jgi:hypothetical protein
MVRNIDDVKAELRKLTNSKPVHAVAGAGVLASQTLKDLPWRLVQWTRDNPPESLPRRANGYVQQARTNADGYVQAARTNANGYVQQARTNATGYVQTARTRAADRYDKLAEQGKKALNGQPDSTPSQSTTPSRSTTQGKSELNGKPKGKAPSSRTGTSN